VIWLFGAALEIATRQHGLDGAGRVRRPFRLLLHRLHLRQQIFALNRARAKLPRCSGSPACWPGVCSTARWCNLGYENMPFISLGLGLMGACAVGDGGGA